MRSRLEDIANFQKGFAFKSKDFIQSGVRIVKVTNLTDESIDLSSCVHIDENLAKSYGQYSLQYEDIIITTVGSWPTNPASVVGKVVKVPKDGNNSLLNQNAVRVRNNGKANQKYLYYLLRSEAFKEYIIGTAQGSANQASITQKDIKNFTYEIPQIKIQDSIAYILSTLDEKIEVNNQINKTLEAMAQALFKHWFIDFEFPNEDGEPYKSSGGEMVESELGMIPKGWGLSILNKIVDFVKASTKPGEHLKDRKYIPIDAMPMKSVTINDYKSYEEAKSSLLLFEKFDILIGAMRVYFHRVNLAPFKGVTRTTTFVLRSKRKDDIAYNLFLLNLNETIDYAEKISKGTTMPYAIWENGLGELMIVHPQESIRREFGKAVFPMLERMIYLAEENTKLQEIRDTLLPKLMSGEIRVLLDQEGEI